MGIEHCLARVLDRVSQLPCRVTENVVTVAIKNSDLISMRQQPFAALMIQSHYKVCFR
jgi:hypothetical protein